MTEPQEDHESTIIADLHDRLVDRALAETVGGETPPDLSARILARDANAICERRSAMSKPLLVLRWTLAVAAAISVVATTVYLFSDNGQRRSARASSKLDRLASRPVESGETRQRGLIRDAHTQIEDVAGRAVRVAESSAPRRSKQGLLSEFAGTAPALEEASDERYRNLSQREGELLTVKSEKSLSIDWSEVSEEQRPLLYKEIYGVDLPELQDKQDAYLDAANTHVMKRGRSRSKVAEGTGPGLSGDQYTRIYENPFIQAAGGDAVSTFSIDVDTASYANVRQFLMEMRQLPPPDAVRIEELVNYFDYDYAGPNSEDEAPFAAHVEVAGCPWAPEHRLVRIGIKGREIEHDKRPPSNLVFLVDVSGSMDEPNKLPLVVDGLRQLTRELGENDRVAIVVYASSEGLALESTRGDNQAAILAALDQLKAGGSTAGGAGIQLAYQIAEDHFIPGGTNRVVLCTDGDFNVGVTSTAELERLVVKKAKQTGVFLSVLGFGRGNLNDAMMQTIADRGNGNHHYVDNRREARKVLVEQLTGTLITIAKDVKIQVEFNPAQVAGYRLLGYENRLLRTEDFNDDTKDAGEIGAGHTVTALYEVIPAGKPVDVPAIDELKYQPMPDVGRTILSVDDSAVDNSTDNAATDKIVHPTDASRELLTLKMRYKEPAAETSHKLEWPVADSGAAFRDASDDFQFAVAVAGFGLLLRDSQYRGNVTVEAIEEIAAGNLDKDPRGYRAEFVELVRRTRELQRNR